MSNDSQSGCLEILIAVVIAAWCVTLVLWRDETAMAVTLGILAALHLLRVGMVLGRSD